MPDVQNFFHKVLVVIFILQKKAIGELYRVIPFSSCAFNVRKSCAHFNFFSIQTSIEQKCKRAPFLLNICVKTIQWHNLWYQFPVFIQSYFGERAVSFKKVSLPESLLVDVVTFGEVLHEVSYLRYE